MITNDAELAFVRSQLAHVDAAIEDLRKTILPKNEKVFNLVTEAPLMPAESADTKPLEIV